MIYIIVFTILSLDQLTKFLITKNLAHQESFPLLRGIFHLTLTHNTGAAFGILKNQVPLFIFTSLFAVFLIYVNIRKHREGKLYGLALSLILGGALGNLIDRVRLGYVIDFLDFRIWPVFNLADSAITIGAVLLGYSILRTKKA
ncbi:MAG: signal peptidase II [Candidatus Omnitrophica bacterium]|nr:signal peptidase II [Candidatus Omnitrophota bacterium]